MTLESDVLSPDEIQSLLTLATHRRAEAQRVIQSAHIADAWATVDATTVSVGSLRMGLLMKHRDIDFHIYGDTISMEKARKAMSILAQHPAIHDVSVIDLIDTDEHCVPCHAFYRDDVGVDWQLDMIYILRGSTYDDYFERMADAIQAVLTPEMRATILHLKNRTPDSLKIMGVEYYQAVIRDGVRTMSDFEAWRKANPITGILHWIPEIPARQN